MGLTQSRWDEARANDWYRRQPWLVGCNFIPSSAINQLEMWQEETFDPASISRELGWAASLGFNTVRVYLHDLLWEADAGGFSDRISQYLAVAAGHDIRTLFVLFDDCWRRKAFALGRQPEPIGGVHNSGWVQSPGEGAVLDAASRPRLQKYVREILAAFAGDERILGWDLYNEPGARGLGEKSLPLLQEVFGWARESAPTQPLTCGVWCGIQTISDFQIGASDIISFHNYSDVESLRQQINQLRAFRRPIICTEYMARTRGSRFQSHLPIFKSEQVGCINWGLVSGKTQTIYPWGSKEDSPEPQVWFHDIFRGDGSPFSQEEVACIRATTGIDDT